MRKFLVGLEPLNVFVILFVLWFLIALIAWFRKKDLLAEYAALAAVVLSISWFLIHPFISSNDSWPANRGEWGVMGDYFGGMLNPILAFFSFIALILTVRLQSVSMQQSHYHSLFQNIDAKIHSAVYEKTIYQDGNGRYCYYDILMKCFDAAKENNEAAKIKEFYKKNFLKRASISEYRIIVLISQASSLLAEYQKKFGKTEIYKNYIIEYTVIIATMHSIGLIDAKEKKSSYRIFNIDKYYKDNGVESLTNSQQGKRWFLF